MDEAINTQRPQENYYHQEKEQNNYYQEKPSDFIPNAPGLDEDMLKNYNNPKPTLPPELLQKL